MTSSTIASVPGSTAELCRKAEALRRLLASLGRVAIAFSGGVDSSYLLAASLDALGPERVLALTADSPLLPRGELARARAVAELLGVEHRVLPLDDLAIPEVAGNDPRRCYFCKRGRFGALLALLAAEGGDRALLHGENVDDASDYRPGTQAARELDVRAPLAEVGLTKAEIRQLSRQRGLPTADIPAAACLATRFPYGATLTAEGLRRVEQAEDALRAVLAEHPEVQGGLGGPVALRVRDHFPVARIEAPAALLPRLAEEGPRQALVARLRALGYLYVTLDLSGYRMGAMNEQLEPSRRPAEG